MRQPLLSRDTGGLPSLLDDITRRKEFLAADERRRELLRKGQIIAFVLLALGGLALCLRWSMKYQGWPPPGAIRGHSEAAKAAIRGSARAVLRGIARPGGGGGGATRL